MNKTIKTLIWNCVTTPLVYIIAAWVCLIQTAFAISAPVHFKVSSSLVAQISNDPLDKHLQYSKILISAPENFTGYAHLTTWNVSSNLQNFIHICGSDSTDPVCDPGFESTCSSVLQFSHGTQCYFWIKSENSDQLKPQTTGFLSIQGVDEQNQSFHFNFNLDYQMGIFFAGEGLNLGDSQPNYSLFFYNGEQLTGLGKSYLSSSEMPSIETGALYNGDLYLAGSFTQLLSSTPAKSIAFWDGQNLNASICRSGDHFNLCGIDAGDIKIMQVFNHELYLGGNFSFTAPNDQASYNIARWSYNAPSFLSQVGQGLPSSDNLGVYTLKVINQILYVGGSFKAVDNQQSPEHIAAWDGAQWLWVTQLPIKQTSGWYVSDISEMNQKFFVGLSHLSQSSNFYEYINGNWQSYDQEGPAIENVTDSVPWNGFYTVNTTNQGVTDILECDHDIAKCFSTGGASTGINSAKLMMFNQNLYWGGLNGVAVNNGYGWSSTLPQQARLYAKNVSVMIPAAILKIEGPNSLH